MTTCGALPVLTDFVCKLRGGSQPILAQASDQNFYVVKFVNNPQGENLLFNEAAGSLLYEAFGLPVPTWTPVYVPESFWDEHPDACVRTATGCLRPSSGICFASRYLGSTSRLLEILPKAYFSRIANASSLWLAWLVDICAQHVDNRQILFQNGEHGSLDAVYVDHGSMFGGARGGEKKGYVASRYLDARIYKYAPFPNVEEIRHQIEALNTNNLWNDAQKFPDEWKTASALYAYSECLNCLSDIRFVRELLDALEDLSRRAQKDAPKSESFPVLRHAACAVLRPEISQGETGCCANA